MATSYELTTFVDILTAVREELKIQASDTTSLNRIRRDINIVYLDEVIPFSQWKWLRGNVTINVPTAFTTGTAAVTVNSSVVTLTLAPGTTKKRYFFSPIGYNEVYRIESHTANSTTLYLESPYTGPSSTAISFKIWTDEVALPSFARETFQITHDFQDTPLESCGLQKFRSYVASLPKAEGRPQFYTTDGYYDPAEYAAISGLPALSTRASDGLNKTLVFASDVSAYFTVDDRIEITRAGDQSYNCRAIVVSVSTTAVTFTGIYPLSESAVADSAMVIQKLQLYNDNRRHKKVLIYPSVNSYATQLHIDFIKEVNPLVNDSDEPIIPIGDRSVLLYGALHRAWSRERNPDEASRNYQLYQAKMVRMAGKLDDSIDSPVLKIDRIYLGAKRMVQRNRDRTDYGLGWGGGVSSGVGGTTVTGTASRAAQFGADGILVGATVTTTELGRLSGILSSAVGISDTNTLTNKSIDATTNTLTNISNGSISASAAISLSKLAALTASRLVVTDGSGLLSASSVTSTEAGFVAGLTSSAVGATQVQALTNKTLQDSTCTFVDDGDATKKFAVQCSGITTATTRTWTVPDSSDTFVGLAATQTLTNKTLTTPVIASITNTAGVTLDGTNTNDSAAAGKIGEIQRSYQGTFQNATTATFVNITTISLTAGDWDVAGTIDATLNTGTGLTVLQAGVSAFSGNTTTDHVTGDNILWSLPPTSSFDTTIVVPAWRVSISSTTTIYLKFRYDFTGGTPQARGRISARRAR